MSELLRDQIHMRQQVLMKSAIYNDLKMRGDKQNSLQFIVQTKRRKSFKRSDKFRIDHQFVLQVGNIDRQRFLFVAKNGRRYEMSSP